MKLKTKTVFIISLTVIFTTIIGLSYGTFIVNTDKYNASELLVSNLLYGIDIKTTGGSETINGRVVTTSTTNTILATITSLNPVDSNYSLEYKIKSGTGKVYYSETTGWKPSGSISKNEGIVYVKTVKVVLVPTSNMTVEFNVNGGYSYNTELLSISEYTKITEEYKDTTDNDNEEPLADVVKKDNNCESAPCLYGGESKNNYLQYPTTNNTTDNIWRITGNINGGVKAVSNITGTTTQGNIVNSLNTFYEGLQNTEEYILKTNNFNCKDTGCTGSSKFNNIGLVSSYEYNKVGGSSSYLANNNNFFSNNNDNIENITPNGIEQTTESTSSSLRPTVYLKEDINVTGKGTASDPYRIYSVGKVITVKYTKNGTSVTELPSKEEYIVESVTCTGGREGRWNEATSTVILTKGSAPTTCTVAFKSGYNVVIKGSTGVTINTPTNKTVGRIGSTSFTFSTTNAYDLTKASVNCGGGASGNVNGSTINITNVTAGNTCTLTIPLKTYAVSVSSNDTNMGTVSVDKTSVEHGRSATITISPKSGYEYASDNCGGTRNGNTITLANIISAKSCTVTFKQSSVNLAEALKKAYPSSGERTTFVNTYTTTTLHTTNDNFGISYYFTGNPNNWVKFGTWNSDIYYGYNGTDQYYYKHYNSLSECQNASNFNQNCKLGIQAGTDMLWRVIRINGDGSVRLLYAGTGEEDGYIGKTNFNSSYNSPAYVGWKYTLGYPDSLSSARENGTPSTIYTYIKTNWFDLLTTEQKSYINMNAIYCNDRNTSYYGTTNTISFPASDRSSCGSGFECNPTLICENELDRFTNGFGLMTADEIVFAGTRHSTSNPWAYYGLNKNGGSSTSNEWWWLMSPANYNAENDARVFYVGNNGYLNEYYVGYLALVRPVTSLKSCVTVASNGDGSGANPYVVNGTC